MLDSPCSLGTCVPTLWEATHSLWLSSLFPPAGFPWTDGGRLQLSPYPNKGQSTSRTMGRIHPEYKAPTQYRLAGDDFRWQVPTSCSWLWEMKKKCSLVSRSSSWWFGSLWGLTASALTPCLLNMAQPYVGSLRQPAFWEICHNQFPWAPLHAKQCPQCLLNSK